MKNLFVILFSLLIISCNENTKKVEKNWEPTGTEPETVIDKSNGFSIEYPSNWEKKEENVDFYTLIIREKLTDTADSFHEMAIITVFPDRGLALNEYVDKENEGFKLTEPDIEFTFEKVKTNNGIDGYLNIFEVNEKGFNLNFIKYWFKNNSTIYSVSLVAEKSKLNYYESTFTRIINSFDWVEE
jgi:hypothetical protein